MAIAVNGGHVSRALDFYNSAGKYFIVGGTQAWTDETTPDSPTVGTYRLRDVVGLKKVDNVHMVIPDSSGTISYRDQNWKIVSASIETTLTSQVASGSTVLPLASVAGISVGSKLRINNTYEGKVSSISGANVTLDTAAPSIVPSGSKVLGGALVEGAKYVYVDCYLSYNDFPLVTYRQIGLCSGVTPNTSDILRSAAYATSQHDEYTSLGTLEIIDNRVPATRDISQRELLSLVIEF